MSREIRASILAASFLMSAVTACAGDGNVAAKFSRSHSDDSTADGLTLADPAAGGTFDFAQVRSVPVALADGYHSIFSATCAADELVIGGYCQCHQYALWINGTSDGRTWNCACNGNPTMVGGAAICVRVK